MGEGENDGTNTKPQQNKAIYYHLIMFLYFGIYFICLIPIPSIPGPLLSAYQWSQSR